ncbi:MAG: hypothetical protein HRU36_01610, partial [Rickettsiales bacterium]|nr:hypothetical protein [Rickettsiales bacterium]
LTTDVNANCDGTAYIAGNTDGSACRLPLTTDDNTNCDANKFIGTSTDGTTCADPLVTNADSTCATSSLVKDVAGTGDGNACTSACTNGQGVDTSSTPECKDIEATLSCDDCVPNGGTCSIQVSDTRTFDGGTGADFTASDCDTVCGASGGAIGQCDITIAFATS